MSDDSDEWSDGLSEAENYAWDPQHNRLRPLPAAKRRRLDTDAPTASPSPPPPLENEAPHEKAAEDTPLQAADRTDQTDESRSHMAPGHSTQPESLEDIGASTASFADVPPIYGTIPEQEVDGFMYPVEMIAPKVRGPVRNILRRLLRALLTAS